MADKKISELTELTTPDGTEELVVNDSGVSKKVQIDNLITGIDDNATSTAITIDASENTTFANKVTVNAGGLEVRAGGEVIIRRTDNGWDYRLRQVSNRLDIHSGADLVTPVASFTPVGITFNGDTAAANALDDYEEGYHDATIYINSVAWTGTVNNRRLRYVKIGKLVHVVGRIYIAGGCPTGSTDYFSFSLPFLSPSGSDYETSNEFQNIRFNDSYTFRLHGGASELKMQNDGSNAAMNVSSPHLNVNLTYISA